MSSQTPYPDYLSSPGTPQQHPALDQMLQFWHTFVTKVDPVTKIIHCPSTERTVFAVVTGAHVIGEPLSILLHSICYAAVASTSTSQVETRFGESKDVLLDRFQKAVEKSLAAAHTSNDFMTLQALIIYLVSI